MTFPDTKTITICMHCGSPRVLRDAYVNVNTGEVYEYDDLTCSDYDYNGRYFDEVNVPASFDLDTDFVTLGE